MPYNNTFTVFSSCSCLNTNIALTRDVLALESPPGIHSIVCGVEAVPITFWQAVQVFN